MKSVSTQTITSINQAKCLVITSSMKNLNTNNELTISSILTRALRNYSDFLNGADCKKATNDKVP